jgi:hypothetical protein
MRHQSLNIALAGVLAATVTACAGGGDRKNEQRGGARGTQERITASGCVQRGSGDSYELRHLGPGKDHTGQASASLPSGSWARLTGGKEMKEYLGQRVTVEGWIAETGQNTIGTSGVSDPGARGETKDAKPLQPTVEAPGASVANGQPPAIAVERVTPEGACNAGQ